MQSPTTDLLQVLTRDDLGMEDLYAAREAFLSRGELSPTVRPVVREAWLRCKAYGVDPKRVRVQKRSPQRLARALPANSELVRVAEPILKSFQAGLGDAPHLLALSDPDGCVLRMFTDPVCQAITAVADNLFEGASWHERDIGCNGIGTSLAIRESVILIGPEHFVEDYVGWTCIGVPLRGPGGEIVGAIEFTVPNEHVNIHTWGWMQFVGRTIERHLADWQQLEVAEIQSALDNLHRPFHSVRGVLDLVARRLNLSPTHLQFLDQARAQLDTADETLAKLADQLVATHCQLRAANASKEWFLAVLGHELRSPLAAIQNLLHVDQARPDARREHRQILTRQVGHLNRLIDGLLDASRVRRGNVTLEWGYVDIAEALKGPIEVARPLIARQGHTFVHNIHTERLGVCGDLTRLEQAFANLLINAAKYTPPGGRIDLSATREQDEVVVRVRDNGIGIKPELLAQIFELFVQDTENRSESDGGLGIGLSLVQAIIALHGGQVHAASDGPGEGSEFTVRLPAAESQ
jgi:signal transduction histidine kinase